MRMDRSRRRRWCPPWPALTGWSLDLAEPIFSGKGGITVSFADTSALFVGPPEEQREEFRVYDALQLDQTILDSLKKTLQCWAVDPELGTQTRWTSGSAGRTAATWPSPAQG